MYFIENTCTVYEIHASCIKCTNCIGNTCIVYEIDVLLIKGMYYICNKCIYKMHVEEMHALYMK